MQRNKLLPWDDSIMEAPHYYERAGKYVCSECNSEYGVIKKKSEVRQYTKCPNCGQKTLNSFILGAPSVQVRGNITTVGQLAEQNTKKLGRYGKEERDRAQSDAEKTGRKVLKTPDKDGIERVKKINKMTREQKRHYINTGEGL